jgi:hypothetical protein
VLNLHGCASYSAVAALAIEFVKQIFANLVASKLALLVLNPADLRILHELKIEPDQLLSDRINRREPPESFDPGQDCVNSMP